ncbi:MAG TPA: Stp1/IreP family PP2C-type Ser/Thr phosphatase [Pseudobdellovibrionaceae bacterium]|nr:Stp1/IreP family PP2C-type Ser/Thr phosphatase [Pseudobdellovibrionaceae bacterium]
MKVSSWVITDKGLRRESNQDSYLINEDLNIFIVADGMGGHSGGEVASRLAVLGVQDTFIKETTLKDPREKLMKAYIEASHRIFDMAQNEKPELMGMGTTMVMAYIQENKIYIANIGDSRCYLFKKPHLWQLTEDHSLINEQIRAGMLNDEQIKNFVGKNVITRSVGYEREVFPDVIERELVVGEKYLLCSDGLSGLVEDEDIEKILNKKDSAQATRLCVEQALANGGDDNVTVLVLEIG